MKPGSRPPRTFRGGMAMSKTMISWSEIGGETGERIEAFDWSATPLGPREFWSERLRGAVEMTLASPLLSTVAVGPQRVLIYNDAAARLYGERHPAALGRPLAETFPESYPSVAALYDRVFAGEAVTVAARPLDVRNDGAGDMFDAYLTPVRDANGEVIAAHMTGFEVGERERSGRALRQSEERLRRVLETDAVGILFFNLDGQLIGANDAFLRMTGYTRAAVDGGAMHWRDMTPPEWLEESEAQMARLAESGRIGPYEKEYFAADGSRRWMLFAGRDLGDGTIADMRSTSAIESRRKKGFARASAG
jgi:PAS domain S-box-containing protein